MRTKNFKKHLSLLTGLSITLASCSIAKNEVSVAQAGPKTAPAVMTTVSTSSRTKTYAFATAKPVVGAVQEEKAVALIGEGRQSYLGSAPYICTPSGFGRKAQCFLR